VNRGSFYLTEIKQVHSIVDKFIFVTDFNLC